MNTVEQKNIWAANSKAFGSYGSFESGPSPSLGMTDLHMLISLIFEGQYLHRVSRYKA